MTRRITQACNNCKVSKRRCTGHQPCRRCFLSNSQCEYGKGDEIRNQKVKKQSTKVVFNIPSGSTKNVFNNIETVVPLVKYNYTNRELISRSSVNEDIYQKILGLNRDSLIDNVTKYLHCGFISFSPEQLRKEFGNCSIFTKDNLTPLVLIVLALGILYEPDFNINNNSFSIAMDLFTCCSDMVVPFYRQIIVDNVEVLSLLSWFLKAIDEIDSCNFISSMSIQAAVIVGLNQNNTDERCKRVWWCAYSINRIFTLRSGLPLTLNKNLIKVKYPQWNELEPIDGKLQNLTYDLAKLAEDINEFYLNRDSCQNILGKIKQIIQELIKWRKSNDEVFENLKSSRIGFSTLLSHCYLIQLTTIPITLHLAMQKLSTKVEKHEISKQMLSIVSISQEYALISIEILTTMSKNSIANFGVFDIDYISTSTLIIGLMCILNMDTAMFSKLEDAIHLLDEIRKHGSISASANYVQLVDFLKVVHNFIETKSNQVSSPILKELNYDQTDLDLNFMYNQEENNQLWETIYNQASLDMDSNWEEFVNLL